MAYINSFLSRVNQYGKNPQERIQHLREHRFSNFVSQSVNKITCSAAGATYEGVLQTKRYAENQIIDYLLLPTSVTIPSGAIITTTDLRFNSRQWIVVNLDPYTTGGNNRFEIVNVDSNGKWLYEGRIIEIPLHYVGEKESSIADKFKMAGGATGVGIYQQARKLHVIAPASQYFHKNLKMTVGDGNWKVTFYDTNSVPGIAYFTLEEIYENIEVDKPYVGYGDLNKWSIACDQGETIKIAANSSSMVRFKTFFEEVEKIEPITIEIPVQYKEHCEYSNGAFIVDDTIFTTTIVVKLTNIPTISQIFSLSSEQYQPAAETTIVGPTELAMYEEAEYTIYNGSSLYTYSSESNPSHFDILSVTRITEENGTLTDNYLLKICGTQIGNDKILCQLENNTITFLPIKILTLWRS